MQKIIYYDLETTGLDHNIHGIHQISFMILVDGEMKDKRTFDLNIFDFQEIDDEALKISGKNRNDLLAGKSPESFYKEFIEIICEYISKFNKKDKFHLSGYNNRGFDDLFLRKFFENNGDKYFGSYFWSDSIDVLVLASEKLHRSRYKLENFQLVTVAKYFQIEVEESKLHQADYDIYLTYEIHKLIQKRISAFDNVISIVKKFSFYLKDRESVASELIFFIGVSNILSYPDCLPKAKEVIESEDRIKEAVLKVKEDYLNSQKAKSN